MSRDARIHEQVERHTSFSNFCWKWTKMTVPTANSDVPSRVNWEARDMVECQIKEMPVI